MPIDNLPPVQPPQQQQQIYPLANPASEEAKVLSPEKRLPVVGRKGKGAKTENDPGKEGMSGQEAEKLAQKMNQIMSIIGKRLQFNVSENKEGSIANIQVKVIDEKSGKVLAVIPPKNLEDLLGDFRDTVGLLFDELV